MQWYWSLFQVGATPFSIYIYLFIIAGLDYYFIILENKDEKRR